MCNNNILFSIYAIYIIILIIYFFKNLPVLKFVYKLNMLRPYARRSGKLLEAVSAIFLTY